MTSGEKLVAGERDTIFALATAPGRAGVAVIRVSGLRAKEAIQRLTRRKEISERRAANRTLYDLMTAEKIDQGIVLFFAGPRSYTGENIAEFQVHGGRAVLSAVAASLSALGLRPAEPGEFSRRAVENGRLDLTRAEAIADLVNAETAAQRRLALDQYGGSLSLLYEDWRTRLICAAAWIEAGIDFGDEDIPPSAAKESHELVAGIEREIRAHLDDGRRGEILREGLHVAVIGPPNAGKSSLVNALAQRDVAIVSDVPGTTRDVIEVRLDLAGFPVILADTAGLRDSGDFLEQEGVRRAWARAEAADLRLLILDGSVGDTPEKFAPTADIVVHNKSDLARAKAGPGFWVSAKTGQGIPELIEELARRAADRLGTGEAAVITRSRHRRALEEAVRHLASARAETQAELKAESVRLALRAIGRITGRVDLDELLDVVFRDFCIGK